MKTTLPARKIITLLGLGTAVSLLGESTLYTVLPNPAIAAQIGITLSMVGILLGTNRAVRIITNGPVGYLYEKLPRRPLLIISLLLGAFSSLLYTTGAGFWPLFIGRVSWGIAWSLLWIGCKTVILEVSDSANRGRLNGHYQMFYMIGIGCASLIGAIMTDMIGFYNGQRLSAVLIFAAAVAWYFLLPETKCSVIPREIMKAEPSKKVGMPLQILISACFIIFIARFIDRGLLAATAPLWMSNLFGEGLQLSYFFIPIVSLTGLYNAIKIVPGILSAPAAGILSDRLRNRWLVMAGGLLIGGLGIWFMGEPLIALAVIGALMVPVIGSSVETLIPAVIGDHSIGSSNGRILGIIYIFADLGSTLGPMVGLRLLDTSLMSLQELYHACVLLILAAVAVAVFAGCKRLKPAAVSE